MRFWELYVYGVECVVTKVLLKTAVLSDILKIDLFVCVRYYLDYDGYYQSTLIQTMTNITNVLLFRLWQILARCCCSGYDTLTAYYIRLWHMVTVHLRILQILPKQYNSDQQHFRLWHMVIYCASNLGGGKTTRDVPFRLWEILPTYSTRMVFFYVKH